MSNPILSDDIATGAFLCVREAKEYLDGVPEAFLTLLADCQTESDPGDRIEALARMAGLIEGARTCLGAALATLDATGNAGGAS